MPALHLTKDDPLVLTLAADIRFSPPKFTNDQIWELKLHGGEPPSLLLQTTYGLRARWMRIFPRFIRKDKTFSNPDQFHTPPQIHQIFPNFIHLSCAPFNGLEVQLEYWAVSSHAVACHMQLKNSTILKQSFRLEWAALLSPLEEGVGMSATTAGPCYLAGKSADLAPVFLLEGCSTAGTGPFPTLVVDMDLYPGSSRSCAWACAAAGMEEESIALAQDALKASLEKQAARIELQNSSQMVEIHTGNENWDAVLMLSQVAASNLCMPGGEALPHASFVLTRQPDQGYSFRGDGSDYAYLWKGQSALDTYYLSSLLLPGRADLVKGWVENFIACQDDAGRIDWHPNLVGQRSRYLAQPLLATLAWQVSRYLPDGEGWLKSLYAALHRFLEAWFAPGMDIDQDGFPEWENAQQTGLEDLPLYNIWHAAAQGLDIRALEAPALASFLVRECDSLAQIARSTGQPQDDLDGLEARQAQVRASLEKSWSARSGLYLYRDAVTHTSQDGSLLKTWRGSGKFSLRRTFKKPQRLRLQLTPFEENTRAVTIRLHGMGEGEEVCEVVDPRRWTWVANQARVTCSTAFNSLVQIEIQGADANDGISLYRADHMQEDISLFLPLWAQVPSQAQAKKMVEGSWKAGFQHPCGAPICRVQQYPVSPVSLNGVSPLWIHLVGQGLMAYGFKAEAVGLVSGVMDAIAGALKRFSSFYEMYDADSGLPLGESSHLRGLAPVGLFLELAGIQKLSTNEIIIHDFNPFPFQVTVKYRSTQIACHTAETQITFANGQIARVSGPGIHRVRLD